jgi:hypothetical protein
MKQEDKELLIRDLCSRLPYKPIVQIDNCGIWNLRGIDHDDSAELRDRVIVWHGETLPSSKNSFPIINCKPFLFPLSSMTEEQKNQLKEIWDADMNKALDCAISGEEGLSDLFQLSAAKKVINWLIKNHFDFQSLIPKELAIDCTNLNVY